MRVFGIALVGMLAGCSGLQSPDPASPHYAYSTGWVIQLDRPLEIEPGAATVRLQYGRIVPRNSVQGHDPVCVVELNTVSDGPQILRPGRFEVWRVTRSESTFAAAASPFVKTADSATNEAPSSLYFKTEFHLRDPAQPALRSMTCAWDQMAPGNYPFMRHLTLAEIRSALGDWMRLIAPTETI